MSPLRFAIISVLVLAASNARAVDRPFDPKAYASAIRPLLDRYCVRCHGADKQEAALRIDTLEPVFKPQSYDADLWLEVANQMSLGAMPPKKEKLRPSADEIDRVRSWILSAQRHAVESSQDGAGQVVIRRLNRGEYNNTIRDCFELELRPADEFPADASDGGFDNIGRALTISPMLMVKYMAAADLIVNRAFPAGPQPPMKDVRFDPERYGLSGQRIVLNSRRLHNEYLRHKERKARFNGAGYEINLDHEGTYRITMRVAGIKDDPKLPVRMALAGGLDVIGGWDVDADEYTGQLITLDVPVRLKYSPKKLYRVSGDGNGDLLLDYFRIQGPMYDVWPSPAFHACFPNGQTEGDERDARRILESFGAKIYRRPLIESDLQPLLAIYRERREASDEHLAAMRQVFKRMLISPAFLYLVEPQRDANQSALNDYELASRLSYFLWSSMPDDELFAAARAGRLHDPKELDRQVVRMIADPKSAAFVDNMTGQWLSLREIDTFDIDPKLWPQWDSHLRDSMLGETKAFFAELLRSDVSALAMLDSDWTMLNARLARHYDIPGIEGDHFRRVALPPGSHRGGVVTQAAVMKILSDGIETKPIKRAAWILENLLADPPPPPPPNVEPLEQNKKGEKPRTLRDRLQQHRDAPACFSCHRKIDPLGFGFENYNALGAWRDHEESKDGVAGAIDASGVMPDGTRFEGPEALKKILLTRQDDFRRCMTEKFLTYALGRGLEFTDAEIVEALAAQMPKHGDTMRGLIQDIVRSDVFRHR